MDRVWKARKIQAPPCLKDTGCLSVCVSLSFIYFFILQSSSASSSGRDSHARRQRRLNATFEGERRLDAMQISVFI